MGKLWGLLFGVTMLGCLGLFLAAPLIPGWWLQEGVSSHYWSIDFLYYTILFIVAFFFILTEVLLVCFMVRYARQDDGKPPQPKPSKVGELLKPLSGLEPHKIELAWTIVPAAILLFIAFAQVGIWADIKYQSKFPDFVKDKVAVVAEVSARQWEWRMRYPSHKRMKAFLSTTNKNMSTEDKKDYDTFGKAPQFDDVYAIPNELHAIKDHPSLVHLNTRDVIHSFNMPQLRIKQDALPGKVIPVWFIPTKSNTKFDEKTERCETKPKWEIACAELCGIMHDRMIGQLYVHETQEDFLKWLEHLDKAQHSHSSK